MQDEAGKHCDATDDASTISNSLSRPSFDESYDKDGSDLEDSALDLSMPQRVRAFRSSEESDSRTMTSEVVGEQKHPLSLIRTPSEASGLNHDTESESELGFRQFEQQDAFG